MEILRDWSIMVRHFKCFEDWQGFEVIRPFNVIIGKNNSGKSTLLDVIQQVTGFSNSPHFARKTGQSEFRFTQIITAKMVEQTIGDKVQFTGLGDTTRRFAESRCVGLISVQINSPGLPQRHEFLSGGGKVSDTQVLEVAQHIRNKLGNPLKNMISIRLRADRDIRKETLNAGVDHIGENGENATQMVVRYLLQSNRHQLVEEQLLVDLNSIMRPDWDYKRIFPKQLEGAAWELFLEDQHGTLVPLSHTGSGVKTILLVLINLHLVPDVRDKPLNQLVFCFEELENNLHPAVQRRLFSFLRDKAVKDGCTFFVTTHSHAVIDLFSKDDQAQLLHIKHDGTKARVEAVSSYIHHCGVLLDLDARASDLLQANVIVWVEGPSDRLYFNHWVSVWSNGELREDVHYQCVWYGGALLSHLSYEPPGEVMEDEAEAAEAAEAAEVAAEELVTAIRVNRHAIVLMDSDRRTAEDGLKLRVERVTGEVQKSGGIAWVTEGREVENYIPADAFLHARKGRTIEPPGKYADVFHALGYKNRDDYPKIPLAKRVTPHITKEMLAATLDLAVKLTLVCRKIREWNGLPEPPPESANASPSQS